MKHIYFFARVSLFLFNTSILFAQSWIPLNGPIGVNYQHAIISAEDDELFVLTNSGEVFTSNDSGVNWKNTSTGLEAQNPSENARGKFIESKSHKLFLLLNSYVYLFDKSNHSWKLQNSSVGFSDIGVSDNGIIYGGTDRLFVSTDDGITFSEKEQWSTHSTFFECLGNGYNYVQLSLGASYTFHRFDDDGSNLTQLSKIEHGYQIIVHSGTKNIINANGTKAYISNDGGKTWKAIISNGVNIGFYKAVELSNGDIIGMGSKCYRSIDGGETWNLENTYKGSSSISSANFISISNSGQMLACNSTKLELILPNQQAKPLFIPIQKPTINQVLQFGKSNIICKSNNQNNFSQDDGQSWNHLNTPNNSNYSLNSYNLHPDGSLFYFLNDSIYIQDPVTQNFRSEPYPVSFFQKTCLVMKTGKVIILDIDKTSISYDKCHSWITYPSANDFIFPSSGPMQCSFNEILYTMAYDTIYYSKDYGLNWNRIKANSSALSPYVFLSKNNIFYWYEEDLNLNSVLYSSSDFGITSILEDSLSQSLNILFIDDYDTKYFLDNKEIRVQPRGTPAQKIVDLTGLVGNTFSRNYYIGENGFIYVTYPNTVLHRSADKLSVEGSQLTGKVIIDENQNCKNDPTDTSKLIWNLIFKNPNSPNINYTIQSNSEGTYSFSPQPGEYNISLKKENLLWEECNSSLTVKVDASTNTTLPDFLIKPLDFCPYLKTDVALSRLRRCFDNNQATISICNSGTEDAINTSLTVQFDQYFENITSNINPILKNGNEWNFEIPEIKRAKCIKLQFSFSISCNASLGEIHCLKAISKNDKECNLFLPLTDTSRMCIPNIGSVDPNDKMAFVNDITEEKTLVPNQDLSYMVRFQNTGTDTAFKVVIKDRLSEHLDWSSLKIVSASHDFSYTLDPTGLLELTFENIMLPDSNINSFASNGFFKYEIKQKKDLKIGTRILNDASIFFDFNSPVLTNLTHLVVNKITRTENINETLYNIQASPNPFNEETLLKLPDEFEGQMKTWSIYDISGTKIIEYYNRDQEIKIQGAQLQTGFYVVHVVADNNLRASGKMVVIK